MILVQKSKENTISYFFIDYVTVIIIGSALKRLLRCLFVLSLCLIFVLQKVSAQETTDNATYYYNNFETATAGNISSLGTTASRISSTTTVDASKTSPLETLTSLSSITPATNAIGVIRWNMVGNGTGNIDMTQNDWEWDFLYRNNSTSANDDPDVMTVGKNEWRYWLIANGYSGNTTQGFYVSHVGNNLVIRYRYDNVAGLNRYNTILTTALPNDQNTYIIKVQRLKGGSWSIYMDKYVNGMTTAKTLAVTSSGTTGSSFSTYYYSYLEVTGTTSARFQWDKFDMYTRVLQFTAVGANDVSNGITPIPYYAGENAIIYGLKIIARGNFNINQLYIGTSGAQLNSYFNSTGQLYRSTDAFYSTTLDKNVSSIQLTSNTAYAGSAINDFIYSSGNTDGSYSVPGYYFISATLSSPLNYGNPIGSDNIIFNGVSSLTGEMNSPSTISFTNSSSTGNTITFLTSNDWKGGTSTNWATGSNWSGGHTPTTSEAARIGVVAYTNTNNQPTLTATSSVGQIIFGSTENIKLNLSSKNLTVSYGIVLNASANVTVTGPGSLTVNNSGSSTSVMASTSILTMQTNANLVNNGTFTLQADASSSASIGQSTGTSTITGTFNVQRYFTANRTYRYLSSPVYTSSQTLGSTSGKVYNLKYLSGSTTSLPITSGPSGGGFDKVGNPTIYVYREDRNADGTVFSGGNDIGVSNITNESLSYVTYNNTTTGGYMPVGNGFLFFYRGTKDALAYRTTFPNPGLPNSTTVTATGSINQGSIPVVLWYNSATANSYQTNLSYTTSNTTSTGLNLVGNPYPCTIDWEQFSTTSSSAGIYAPASYFFGVPLTYYVSGTIYEFNPVTNNFDTYTIGGAATGSGSRYIGSGQGFFVRVSPPPFVFGTTSLTFNEAAKASSQQITTFLGTPKTETAQWLRLKVAADSIHTDDILFYFKSDGSTTYLPALDALDIGGVNPLVSISAIEKTGKFMAFKNLPPVSDTLSAKVYVSASATGNNYTITGSGFESMDQRYDAFLIDHYRKDSLQMNIYKTYRFDIDKSVAASYGKDRFEMVFHKKNLPPYALLSIAGTKVQQGAQINWKVDNEFNYTGFELQKQDTASKQFVSIYERQSDSSANYSFIDTKPIIGNNTYRLKQTDPFGVVSYSQLVVVSYTDKTAALATSNINVYPNPASSTINLAIKSGVNDAASSYNIQIANSSGLIIRQANSSQPTWQGNISDLLPGSYVIKVIDAKNNSLVGNSKFVKL